MTGEAIETMPTSFAGIKGLLLLALILAGTFAVTGGVAIVAASTVNALADSSPPVYQPVQIQEMIMETHSFIVRTYKIKYNFLDSEGKKSILSTPEHMDAFDAPFGFAEIHQGYFGWPWIKEIHPIKAAEIEKLKLQEENAAESSTDEHE